MGDYTAVDMLNQAVSSHGMGQESALKDVADALGIVYSGDVREFFMALEKLKDRVQEFQDAIKKHRSMKADDRCWMDDQELYAVLKDGDLGDNRVGDKAAMLKNCERFIEKRCAPGQWKTYADLETQIRELETANLCDACGGTGKPVSSLPCMCGGSGRASDAVTYLRDELLKAETRITELEAKQCSGRWEDH